MLLSLLVQAWIRSSLLLLSPVVSGAPIVIGSDLEAEDCGSLAAHNWRCLEPTRELSGLCLRETTWSWAVDALAVGSLYKAPYCLCTYLSSQVTWKRNKPEFCFAFGRVRVCFVKQEVWCKIDSRLWNQPAFDLWICLLLGTLQINIWTGPVIILSCRLLWGWVFFNAVLCCLTQVILDVSLLRLLWIW